MNPQTLKGFLVLGTILSFSTAIGAAVAVKVLDKYEF